MSFTVAEVGNSSKVPRQQLLYNIVLPLSCLSASFYGGGERETLEYVRTVNTLDLFWWDYLLNPNPKLTLVLSKCRVKLQGNYVRLCIKGGNEIL